MGQLDGLCPEDALSYELEEAESVCREAKELLFCFQPNGDEFNIPAHKLSRLAKALFDWGTLTERLEPDNLDRLRIFFSPDN